jgi:hypothetical protein
MISTTIEENFGYTALESMTFNTIPICPNKFSYPEVIGNTSTLYNSYEELIKIVDKVLNTKQYTNISYENRVKFYDNSVKRMIKCMEEFL